MIKLFEIATKVSTPIALAGLVVMVVYAVIRQLLKSGIIPPLDKSAGGRTLNLVLKGLFILSVIAIILGFAGYIVSLYAPQRTPPNVATKDDIKDVATKDQVEELRQQAAKTQAQVEELLRIIATLKGTDKETRQRAEAFAQTSGDAPAPPDLIAANNQLKQQLTQAQALIDALHAKSATPPPEAVAAVDSARATVQFASNAIGMVAVSANIAEHLVKPQTAARIRDLLGGQSIADPDVAGWSYQIRVTRHETSASHHVDIPIGAASYDAARDCKNNACIIAAIQKARTDLADTHLSREARAEALKMLVGLMADLHRPLHCASRNNDLGANKVDVRLGAARKKLHAVWDSDIFRARLKEKGPAYADDLLKLATTEARQRESAGAVTDWAWESHQIAATRIYPEIPLTGETQLPADYLTRHGDIIDRQILRAGIRLAAVLDAALGG